MHLSIKHQTRYEYDPAASRVALRLKLFPPTTSGQRVENWCVQVNGASVEPLLHDGFGEGLGLWHAYADQETVLIEASGEIHTSNTSGVLGNLFQSLTPGVCLRETKLTEADDAIRELANASEGSGELERLHSLSGLVFDAIDYRPNTTGSDTAAAAVVALGAGVCQDQAHVFISAARTLGTPARYVAGYLLDPDAEEPTEQTHAWAEAYVKGLGWVGFDITNALCPTDGYVRLSTGLDAFDAAPVRGAITGSPDETLAVSVEIEQASSNAQQ